MIHFPGPAEGAVTRVIAALRARGVVIDETGTQGVEAGATLLLSTPVDFMRLGVQFAPWRVARGARIVVLSRVGAHPDSQAQGLLDLWQLEEYARVSLIPTLTLRLGPLVGEQSPFWLRLASRPKLGREANSVVMPVLESDAIQAVAAALAEERPSEGWYELTGPDARSLGEWCELAAAKTSVVPEAGAWEPPLEELVEQRLSESGLWQERFGVRANSVTAWAGAK